MTPRARLTPGRHGPAIRAGVTALLLMAGPALRAAAAAPPRTRHVLFLNSYQPGYAWSDDIIRAVSTRLSSQPNPVELWVEYLDTRRFGGPDYEAELLRMIQLKYRGRHFDLIVSSDDAALTFLLHYHDAIFDGVPVVFCGVNDESLAAVVPRDTYTGVREVFGSGGILELARTLRPGTRQFVVVTDASETSTAAGDDFRAIAGARHDLSFTFLDGHALTIEQILEALAAVPPAAAVIATSFERDTSGRYFPRSQGIARIVQASPAPVYSPSVSELGQGLLAGSENGGTLHGQLAADLAERVLNGARPADLRIGVDEARRFPVDWDQLRRWAIDPDRLPPSAVVVNRPPSFYRANRVVVWMVGLFIVIQAAIIATLVENIRRRRRADRALHDQAHTLADSNEGLARANESLVREMAERRQAEEQLRQAQKIDAVGRLAGGIAHDFNNLLTVVSSYSELALDRLPPDEPAHAHIREIRRASERAASLTQQLLAFSRKQVLQPSVVSLNDVIAGVLPMLRRLISEDVSLTPRLSPDLLPVLVDPGQIEQAIVNLVVNARDAMPRGGHLVIETSNADVVGEGDPRHPVEMAPARYALLSVSDSGHGMDQETQSADLRAVLHDQAAPATAPASDWRWCTGSSSRAAGGSGSTPSRVRARRSRSTCRRRAAPRAGPPTSVPSPPR